LRTADVYGHAFMRARGGELNVSWDRVDDQSQIDHPVAMSSPTADAGRSDARPHLEQLVAQGTRYRDAGLQDPGPHGELTRPPAEVVLAPKLMNRGFDQRPAHPRRPGLGDPAAPLSTPTALDPRHEPGVAGQVWPVGKTRHGADLGAQ